MKGGETNGKEKIILALLASAMMFTALAPHTIAAETSYVNGSVVPLYENDCDLTSILAIVGTKATCRSTAARNTLKATPHKVHKLEINTISKQTSCIVK